jgi:hypothetical protein
MLPPFKLTDGPFLEFRLSVQMGKNAKPPTGGRVGRKLLIGSNWWIN